MKLLCDVKCDLLRNGWQRFWERFENEGQNKYGLTTSY